VAQGPPARCRAIEETNLSSMENNPSWLLPLLPSRATGALLALLYLHPDRDYTRQARRARPAQGLYGTVGFTTAATGQ
jgi:hypothetical protein